MRSHDHDEDAGSARPKSSRIDSPLTAQTLQAVGQRRPDVLDSTSILGLQRAVGNGAVTSLIEEERSPVHDVISSGGSPLAPDVRAEMEGRLGHDFGDVRVHNDSAAHASAQAVNAHAYTVGSNVVFQRDRYDPTSTEGKTTLAHELTHVVQQRSGPVDGTPTAGGINVSDPSDRFEREAAANAATVMSAPAPEVTTAAPSAGAPAIQRDAVSEDEEEPTAQGSFVQREDATEEEKPDEEVPVP